MYRSWSCVLIILLLNGCANIDGVPSSRVSPESSGQARTYQAEKQALFDQPYVDPLTDYLIEHQGDPDRERVVEQVRQERDQRCLTVATQYADKPATEQMLRRYNISYGYSCPQQVAAFEKRVTRQAAEPAPPSELELRTPAASVEIDSARDARVSDQALSDCYLLTTIRNFSAAKEACREPADKGDVRSQANMAVVAYAFEDFANALDWARKAAPGSGEAAFLLGQMYAFGRGVSQNIDKAVYWYKEAVRQGHREAQAAIDSHLKNGSEGDT
jgi:hypothetical protein